MASGSPVAAPAGAEEGREAPGPAIRRPGVVRLALIVLLGPLIGTFVVFFVPFLVDPSPQSLVNDPGMAGMIFTFGYLFGIIPSSLAAFVYARAAPQLATFWWRLLGCLAIGAFCGGLGVFLPVGLMAGEFVFELSFMLLSGLAGAIALTVIALPFSKAKA